MCVRVEGWNHERQTLCAESKQRHRDDTDSAVVSPCRAAASSGGREVSVRGRAEHGVGVSVRVGVCRQIDDCSVIACFRQVWREM